MEVATHYSVRDVVRRGRCRGPIAPRRGVTLLEILLVLAVLVIFAALAVPVLFGPLENQQVRKAADTVRAAWLRASNESVRSGRMYIFRYEPQGRGYTIEPWASADDYLESDDTSFVSPGMGMQSAAPVTTAPSASASAVPGASGLAEWKQLPEGIVFAGGQTAPETRAGFSGVSGIEEPAELSSAEAPPILFYPDGTCSTAELILSGSSGQCVQLRLRGLTATSEASDLFRMDGIAGATP